MYSFLTVGPKEFCFCSSVFIVSLYFSLDLAVESLCLFVLLAVDGLEFLTVWVAINETFVG